MTEKHSPEVGDVWQRKLLFDRVHIVQVSKKRCEISNRKNQIQNNSQGFFSRCL